MVYYIVVAILASALTVSVMKLFNRFVEREIEKAVLSREKLFKKNHKLYWAFGMGDGSIEFWAYDCKSDEKWYLGKKVEGKIIESEGFFSARGLEWDVQKSAVRIFNVERKYEKDTIRDSQLV